MTDQPTTKPQSSRKWLKTIAFCGGVLIVGLLLLWSWNRQLNDGERRLLGRWSYRPERANYELRFIEFRDNRIAELTGPKGLIGYEDWCLRGEKLVLTEYQYRTYGEPATHSMRRVVNTLNGMLHGGSTSGFDLSTTHQLTWKGPDQIELRWPSWDGKQTFVLTMQRVTDETQTP